MLHMDFSITRDYYEEDVFLYKKNTVTLYPGLTILVGCNGCGKSTLIKQMEHSLDKEEIEYYNYDYNLERKSSKSKAFWEEEFSRLSALMFSSEGEEIVVNLQNVAAEIGTYCREHRDGDLWIFLDSIDSGLSIDTIIELKDFFDTIINDRKTQDVYIIVASNNYEMAHLENCFDTVNGVYRTFNDYEDYKDYVLDTQRYKNNRHKKGSVESND